MEITPDREPLYDRDPEADNLIKVDKFVGRTWHTTKSHLASGKGAIVIALL